MRSLALIGLLLMSCPVAAQTNSAQAPQPIVTDQQPAQSWTVTVKVTDGLTKAPVPDAVVFLRAARPKGPFEPTDPEPASEWTAIADANGIAQFASIPATLATSGLRLHAATTWHGMTFKSAAVPPADKLGLSLDVFEKGVDLNGFKIASLRTVVEPWEDYLIFTQFYMLTNTAKTALDTSMLPGEEFKRGLPIRLPVKAQGIRPSGPGNSMVVDSLVYWKGTIRPNEQIPLQVSFSMAAHSPDFVYEQELAYPVDKLEILVPLQTRFPKMPRLNDVTLTAPGYKMDSGFGLYGMRNDMEFIGGTRSAINAGDSLKFKIDGLPFHRPVTPFIVLGVALLSAVLIGVAGRREVRRVQSDAGKKDLKRALEEEREELLEQLVQLRLGLKSGTVTEVEHEEISLRLRERLALVMKKLSSIDSK